LLVGFFVAITRPDGGFLISPLARQAVIFGFLGGFTTFSSFAMQTLLLVQEGEWAFAGLNVLLSVLFCLLAAWLGHAAGLLVTRA
jgi:CrcB protein